MAYQWIESLLFGSDRPVKTPPELSSLEFRLQMRDISVAQVRKEGGFVRLAHNVSGDLDRLVDHFEQFGSQVPEFHTRAVTRTFNHLLATLHQNYSHKVASADAPQQEDREILASILAGKDLVEPRYQSAQFWGDLARQLIDERRPLPQSEPLSSHPPETWLDRLIRLYDVTAKTWGRWFDPLDYVFVSRSQYVDPVHFANGKVLSAFIELHSDHPLSRATQELMTTCVIDRFLDCRMPPGQFHHSGLEILIENVSELDGKLPRVHDAEDTPKTVDVFQRLTAACGLDHLWRTRRRSHERDEEGRDALWNLTRKIDSLQRHNDFLVSLFPR